MFEVEGWLEPAGEQVEDDEVRVRLPRTRRHEEKVTAFALRKRGTKCSDIVKKKEKCESFIGQPPKMVYFRSVPVTTILLGAMDIPDPTLTVEALSNSLDELEGVLDPLFEQTLQQNLDKLDAIQKAKMSVLVAYVIQDLVMSVYLEIYVLFTSFMRCMEVYLKTKGIDPKTELVTTEMVRFTPPGAYRRLTQSLYLS